MVDPSFRKARFASAVLLTVLALGLTACTFSTGNQPDEVEFEESSDPVPAVEPEPAQPAPASAWTCVYDETYNYDWHDDVLCSNGTDVQRPYLREWDDFIEEGEIMESAREYEAELNAGG